MAADPVRKKILLVCMGNICRSPMAQGVVAARLKMNELDGFFGVDSAGTHAYMAGEPPDRRAISATRCRGYDITALRARKVRLDDFSTSHLVLAMDRDNLACLHEICPPVYRPRLKLFLRYARGLHYEEVPDPYYGGQAGFEVVLEMVENAAQGLIEALKRGDT